jgi:hypothetical protein
MSTSFILMGNFVSFHEEDGSMFEARFGRWTTCPSCVGRAAVGGRVPAGDTSIGRGLPERTDGRSSDEEAARLGRHGGGGGGPSVRSVGTRRRAEKTRRTQGTGRRLCEESNPAALMASCAVSASFRASPRRLPVRGNDPGLLVARHGQELGRVTRCLVELVACCPECRTHVV